MRPILWWLTVAAISSLIYFVQSRPVLEKDWQSLVEFSGFGALRDAEDCANSGDWQMTCLRRRFVSRTEWLASNIKAAAIGLGTGISELQCAKLPTGSIDGHQFWHATQFFSEEFICDWRRFVALFS
jgi:hypothetical protein